MSNRRNIYVVTANSEPIQQGDIFSHVPQMQGLTDVLNRSFEMRVMDGIVEAVSPCIWNEVDGIVISQDCDAIRNNYVVLARIATRSGNPQTLENVVKDINNINKSLSTFYLPECEEFSIGHLQVVLFDEIFVIRRRDLLQLASNHRLCRLDDESVQSLRFKLAHYFSRVPFDGFHALNNASFLVNLKEAWLDEEKRVRRNGGEIILDDFKIEWNRRFPGSPFPRNIQEIP